MSDKKEETKQELKFPESFTILPEYIENINDLYLLNLFKPLVEKNSLIKNLLKSKLTQLTSNKISETDELLSKTEKDSGNNFMKNQNFNEAITHYTYSIISNPNESTTYCNRGFAYMKINEEEKAILDFTNAINLNNNYVKAYYRRAMCYSKIKKYKLAYDDLLYLINSDNDSQEVENLVESNLKNWKKDVGDNFKGISNQLINDLNQARSHQLIINIKPWEISKEKKESFEKWDESAKKVKEQIILEINKKEYNKANDIVNICYQQCFKFKEGFDNNNIYYIKILNSMKELNCLKLLLDNAPEEKKEEVKKVKKANLNRDNFFKTSLLSKEQREKATKIAEEDIKFSDFSKSAYGFEKAFNSFKDRDEKFFEFINYFEGKSLGESYKNTEIPVPILNGIIKCFKNRSDNILKYKDLFIEYFDNISKSKSFGLVKNFIKKSDKELIRDLLSKISNEDSSKKELCDKLINEYK